MITPAYWPSLACWRRAALISINERSADNLLGAEPQRRGGREKAVDRQPACPWPVLKQPFTTIDLGKGLYPTAAWRPFHLKQVAAQRRGIEVGFEGECRDEFSSSLAQLPQSEQGSLRLPVHSLNSRRAAASGSSLSSYSPLAIDQAPRTRLCQNGPPGWTSSTCSHLRDPR